MLSRELMTQIRDGCQEYWDKEVQKEYFHSLAQGKEIGHRTADIVDEKTTALLTVNYETCFERHANGAARPRSMGDIWLRHDLIYHPINVKVGIAGSEGQPNMVSLKKLLNALISRHIDSYYLLIVKLSIGDPISPQVYFTDMLDHLAYVTFDSGTGQIMLKAKPFFTNFNPEETRPIKTTEQKVRDLLNLLEDGERRLQINRERVLKTMRQEVSSYLENGTFQVTPETQEGLHLL